MRENRIPIIVCSIRERGGLVDVLAGHGVYTVVAD
jgi:hypothetical protein